MLPVILIGGGLVALYFLRQPAAASAGTPDQLFQQERFQAIGTPPALTPNTTDAQITGGLAAAAAHDPEPISKGVLTIATKISSFFTQHHQDAMKREGITLNNATPSFLQGVQYVFDGLNQGAISQSQAVEYLKQLQADYESTTSSVRRDNGQCIPGCSYDGHSYGSTHCCNSGSQCNAACCIRCGLVVPAVKNLTALIAAGGGRYTVAPFPTNGYIKGTPAVTFTYMPPNSGSVAVQGLFARLGL